MIEAVFISDLHLHPNEPLIYHRFQTFIDWAIKHVKSVYILGDFFHVWPGDEALDEWSMTIARLLSSLHDKHINVYFMPGNRDFLVGSQFIKYAHLQALPDPSIITLGNERVLLTHGDRYCINDKGHQWLRWLTRNRWFSALFLRIPYKIRKKMVSTVRYHSATHRQKSQAMLAIVVPAMLAHLDQLGVQQVIHGHIHQPKVESYCRHDKTYHQYVLSDWDDKVHLVCYDKSKGFYFELL